MTLALLQIGTAVPDTTLPQPDALRLAQALACPTAEQETWLPSMYTGTGIRTRQVVFPPALVRDVLEGTRESGSVYLPTGDPADRGPTTAQRMEHYARLAPPLAVAACRQAITAADIDPQAFTHLVTVSCTGFFAPGLDRMLVQELGLPMTVERTMVGYMGCHGGLNGLRVANAFAAQPRAGAAVRRRTVQPALPLQLQPVEDDRQRHLRRRRRRRGRHAGGPGGRRLACWRPARVTCPTRST
ncbi:MAG: hypothetical protein U0736_05025 [Gemmataceae bacterium]